MLIKLKYLDKFAVTMFLEKSTEMAHLKFEPTMARLEVGIEAAILLGEGLKIVQNDIEHLGSYLTFWSMRLDWQTCFAFHSLVKRSPSGSIWADTSINFGPTGWPSMTVSFHISLKVFPAASQIISKARSPVNSIYLDER